MSSNEVVKNLSLRRIQELFDELGYQKQSLQKTVLGEKKISARDGEWFQSLVKLTNSKNILEFETWQGKSTLSWVNALKEAKLSPNESSIVCVDTWLGSWEHVININPNSEWSRDNLELVNGRPNFFESFLTEMWNHGAIDYIYPFSGTTDTAYEVFKRLEVKFDLIYIDASHDYLSVTRDLVMARDLIQPGGIIAGDDFDTWDSVKAAVIDFATTFNLQVMTGFGQFLVIPVHSESKVSSQLTEMGWTRLDVEKDQILEAASEESRISAQYALSLKEGELHALQLQYELIQRSNSWKLVTRYARLKRRILNQK